MGALLCTLCACAQTTAGPQPPTPPPPPGGAPGTPDLGAGASLNGALAFPADNPWNVDISAEPVDPSSSTLVASCGYVSGAPDSRWDDEVLGALKTVPSSAFEVVRMPAVATP